jgi:hypothetical protein
MYHLARDEFDLEQLRLKRIGDGATEVPPSDSI